MGQKLSCVNLPSRGVKIVPKKCGRILWATPKEIDARDEFLSTPLHYAAFRGAAVCCLLLLERNSIEYQQTDSSVSKELLVYWVVHNAINTTY